MPPIPTTSLRLEKQETGSNLNIWGEILGRVLDMVDQAIAGVLIKPLAGNVTLTNDNYISNEARNAVLVFTNGGLTAAPTVIVPLAPKSWHVNNQCGYPITFTMGGSPVTVPIGRQAKVICDGTNLFMLEPVGAAAAVTEGFAQSAATSAQTAMTSASTATTRRDQALAARDETYAARDATFAARDLTLGYRNAAATSATQAANSAAGVNLPAITSADAGKVLTVKPDGSGYAPLPLNPPLFKPITMTTPTAGATNVGAGGTYTFVVEAFPGDTTGFYPDYPVPLASRFVDVFEPGGNAAVKRFTVSGTGVAFPVSFTGSGLLTSHLYEFQAGYQAADGSSVLSQRVQATTTAVFKPGVGQSYQGGFLAFESFGDGGLSDLVVAPKSTEASKVYATGGSSTTVQGALSRTNGLGNTTLLNNNTGGPTTFAAGYAASVVFGSVAGYLGAIDQLRCVAFNLAPSKAAEAAFKAGGSEVFDQTTWSSTELTASNAVRVNPTDGSELSNVKTSSFAVRAIKSVAVTPPIAIGTYVAAQGGWLAAYFTDFSGASPVTYGLFVSDKTVEVQRAWTNGNNITYGANSRTSGVLNTSSVQANSTEYSAAITPSVHYCANLNHGGKTDWRLGAIDEMLAIARMNASLPSAQQLPANNLWSSTEIDAGTAKIIGTISAGTEQGASKTNSISVRPIRRVPLSQLAA